MRINIDEHTWLETRTFGPDEFAYWEQFGVNPSLLARYNVHLVHSYGTVSKEGKPYERKAAKGSPIFAYEASSEAFKLYVPLVKEKGRKFRWLGSKPQGFIFGYNQLPVSGEVVILAAGEKDALTVNALGYPAISLNSETAKLSSDILKGLRARFKLIVSLYDADEAGLKAARKLEEEHDVRPIKLPPFTKPGPGNSLGKDISEYVHARGSLDWLQEAIIGLLKLVPVAQVVEDEPGIAKLLQIQSKLRARTKEKIVFQKPILSHFGKPMIYPNTIVAIQGQTGTHKSRLIETMGSAILKKEGCDRELLGFEKADDVKFGFVYIDTERNWQDQLPYALQQIKLKGGYKIQDDPPHFWYTSLIEISRPERLKMLEEYIEYISSCDSELHLLVVLDVVTDCVIDFNRSDESMAFIQTLNRLINQQNLTFVCLIHENPGTNISKARGHLGTEIANKASTLIQIGFEKESQYKDSELVRIKLLKFRQGKRPGPIYARYDDKEGGLVLAAADLVNEVRIARFKKGNPEEVAEYLGDILASGQIPKTEASKCIQDKFECGERTARERIKELIDNETFPIRNPDNQLCVLKEEKKGKSGYLFLAEMVKD